MAFNDTPYLDSFAKLSKRFPTLRLFDRFSSSKDKRTKPRPKRYDPESVTHPGRVAVIEFADGPDSAQVNQYHQQFENLDELSQYLATRPSCRRRLFLMEDLWPPYVEVLGRYLGVDPRVFASHFRCVHWDNSQVGVQRILRSSRSLEQTTTSFFTLKYYEPWNFAKPRAGDRSSDSGTSLFHTYDNRAICTRKLERSVLPAKRKERSGGKARAALMSARPARDMEKGDAVVGSAMGDKSPVPESQVFLLRGNASFWFRSFHTKKKEPSSWDGLMLLDPGLTMETLDAGTHAKPSGIERYQGGYPDILQLPTVHAGPSRSSMYDDILHYWRTDERWKDNLTSPMDAAKYLKQLVATHWNCTLNHLWGAMSYLEYDIGNIEEYLSVHPESQEERYQWSRMETNLRRMNTLRRRLNWYLAEARENLYQLKIDDPHDADDLEKDFQDITERLDFYKSSSDSLMNVAGSVASLRQAKQGLVSSYFVNLLTMLGVVIFPLTFLCAVFSMGGRFQAGEPLFWVYWVIAVPLAATMMAFVWVGKKKFTEKQQKIHEHVD